MREIKGDFKRDGGVVSSINVKIKMERVFSEGRSMMQRNYVRLCVNVTRYLR
jgi:hypothetical protein